VTGDDLRQSAFQFAEALWDSQRERERREEFLRLASMYAGKPILNLLDFDTSAVGEGAIGPRNVGRTPRNLVRTLVDTALSRFAKSETRVQFLTDGGTPEQQERAETCTDAANALVIQTGAEKELRKAALHAGVFDLGAVKVLDGDDGPTCEHTHSWELMFDAADAHRGHPKILVQRFPADRDELEATFCSHKADETPEETKRIDDLIEDLRVAGQDGLTTPDHTASEQHLIVYELWRLPVGRKKGRHVVVTDNALLLDEEWKTKRFPFAFFGWCEALIGAYPTSIAAIVMAVQDELDGVGNRISQVLRQMAVPQWTDEGPPPDTDGQSTYDTMVLRGGSDAIGDVIPVAPGHKLTRVPAGPVVGPELFNHEDRTWQRGFAMTGINEQAAMGTRPAGLNSAPAQREWNEINQDRLSLVALEYQQAHVDVAELLLESIAEMPEYVINVKDPNGKWLKRMRAQDLHLDRSDFVIQKFPIGALPLTPTGRLAAAADLLQAGGIDVDEFRDICNFPDLKAKLKIRQASEKATEALISRMLTTGEFQAPPDFLDFAHAIPYSVARWCDGMASKPPMADDRLALLENFIQNCKAKLPPPPPPPAPMPLSTAPMPPPPLAPQPAPMF
jgi:hypothetical protein